MKLIAKGSPEWNRGKESRQRAIKRCIKIGGKTDAVEIGWSAERLAKRIGVSGQAVSAWLMAGEVPPERVLTLVALAEGRVAPFDLRPDLYPRDMVLDHASIPLPVDERQRPRARGPLPKTSQASVASTK